LLNPTLIVEVMSESTADYDKGRKFDHYRTIQVISRKQDTKLSRIFCRVGIARRISPCD